MVSVPSVCFAPAGCGWTLEVLPPSGKNLSPGPQAAWVCVLPLPFLSCVNTTLPLLGFSVFFCLQ